MIPIEGDFTLRWPRELFIWEARELLKAPRKLNQALPLLLDEAFEETDVREEFSRFSQPLRNAFDAPVPPPDGAEWLRSLLALAGGFHERELRPYWSVRNGLVAEDMSMQLTLNASVFHLIREFQESGYFPRVLPKYCVDGNWRETDALLEEHLRRATQLRIKWPASEEEADKLPEHVVFTLIEFFHDQAQRPRGYGYMHTFSDCGAHFDAGASKSSGEVVYRWRMNELLRERGVALELSSMRGDRGRLVSRVPDGLEDAMERVLSKRSEPGDEVAHAIRDYRSRHAGRPQKVAAVTLLAGELEKRKSTLHQLLPKKDESALFEIANKFSLRHRNESQRSGYGDDFLDWIFHLYVSTIALLDSASGEFASESG